MTYLVDFCRSRIQNIEEDPSPISRRVTYSTFAYLILKAISIILTLPQNGRVDFINKISKFLAKSDALSTHGFKNRNLSLSRFMVASAIIVSLEFAVAVYFPLKMGSLRNPARKHVQWHWVVMFYARFIMVVLEQVVNLICVEIKIRFCMLNEKIRSLRPEHQFFYKAPSHALASVKTASAQFYYLSLALQAVQDHFGLFWLLNVIHLGTIVIVISATMPIFGVNLSYSAFVTLASLRLVLLCDVCGDTSSQVRFWKRPIW